jgi:hypothetical protein
MPLPVLLEILHCVAHFLLGFRPRDELLRFGATSSTVVRKVRDANRPLCLVPKLARAAQSQVGFGDHKAVIRLHQRLIAPGPPLSLLRPARNTTGGRRPPGRGWCNAQLNARVQ